MIIMSDVVTVIMAGGLGKRMKSNLPKVLHEINGKPMICHTISLAQQISKKICIVVGKYKNIIQETVSQYFPDLVIEYILQSTPQGTGHCIQCCIPYLNANFSSTDRILILSGDVPLLSLKTLHALLDCENSILITERSNPHGYGRVVLNNGKIVGIIEEKDCSIRNKEIKMVNCGIYCIELELLKNVIFNIDNNNCNNEYYLPDIVKFYHFTPTILPVEREYEVFNINTPEDMEIAKQFTTETEI